MEPTLEQSIEQLLAKAPGPVRSFVLNELSTVTERLMTRHQLHVDQAGILEAELLLVLVGQSTPDEFFKALSNAGISEDRIRLMTTDLDNEVFKRIRKEERELPQTVKPAVSPTAPTPPLSRTPVPIYSPLPVSNVPSVPPSRVQPPPNLPGQLPEPPAPRPTPPPPHIEVPAPPAPPKTIEQPIPQPEQHARIMHTMARDMEALKSGADPLRVAHPAPPAWAEAPSKPAPVVPPPAPVVPPQVPKPEQPVTPTPPQTPNVHEAPQSQEALRTHLKQYGVDPYREPVE
jgi:hypothetical protein